MPTLGIIGCTVLSDELAYLVARDPEISRGVVVDNSEGRKLAGILKRRRACGRVDLVEVDRLGSRSYNDDEVVLWANSTEMHNSQSRMRNAMTSEIKLLSGSVDCVLLLYGQCRCQTLDIGELEEETGVPVLYLIDDRNIVVDDCISAIMGSSDRYLRTMNQHKGAFFLTPGYVDGYSLMMDDKDIVELMDEIERMNQAFDLIGRPPLIKLDNRIDGGPEYHGMIDMFARTFDLEVLTIPCDMRVFEGSYDWARSVMKARTRNREPVAIMAGSSIPDMLASEDIWDIDS